MAILFRLDVRGDSPRERLLNVISFLNNWLDNVDFKLEKIELWEDSYLEIEDGKKLGEYGSIESFKAKIANFDDIYRVDRFISLIKGTVNLETPIKLGSANSSTEVKLDRLPACMYIFDRAHRRTLRAYALFYTFTVPDWRLFLTNSEFKERISESTSISGQDTVKLRALIVGLNQLAGLNIRYHVFAYYRRRREFIEDILRTIKEEIEGENDDELVEETSVRRIPDILTPYNLDFLVSTLDSYDDAIENRLKEFYIKNELAYEVGSIKLIAPHEKAFENFYKSFRDDFVSFFVKEFPDIEKIKKSLQKWVTKTANLSDFVEL